MIMPQADSPTTGFRPFFNPATGEWVEYTAIAADSDGQLVRFNWRSVPGGVITEHIHPRQEERFTILAGEAHFTLNGTARVARAGETIVVPAGMPHSEGNPGPGEIEGVVELRPALHTKEWHEALAGLVADGKTTPAARRKTRSSSAPPSGTSATKAASPHPPSGPRTSCSRPCGHWPSSSASAPTTTTGTAGPDQQARIPEEHRDERERPDPPGVGGRRRPGADPPRPRGVELAADHLVAARLPAMDPAPPDQRLCDRAPRRAGAVRHRAGSGLGHRSRLLPWRDDELYRRLARFEIGPQETLGAGLARLGYAASDVDPAVISHLHQDHIGGLAELGHAGIVVSQAEWDTLSSPLPEMRGLMRRHIDLPGLHWRRIETEPTEDPGLAPFRSCHDLFGDGSLVLLPTPGHTAGSMSLLVRRPGRPPLVMVGDLTYDAHLLEGRPRTRSRSRRRLREATAMINAMRQRYPGLVILPAHDPGAASRLAQATGQAPALASA